MKEFLYTVTDPNGIHARPAGRLATFAKQFHSTVKICWDGKEADAKRLLSVMSLGAIKGTVVRFVISGSDEEDAMVKLQNFCEMHLGERGGGK